MKRAIVLFLLSWVLFPLTASQAGDFAVHGAIGSFKHIDTSDFMQRTIVYYIPKSIAHPEDLSQKQKTLVFLHGGGLNSTNGDADAAGVAKQYLELFVAYAEANQVMLIFPASGFGWNAQTRYFLRELLDFASAELPIDRNHVVLSGHSMGGMGITREYSFLTDVFSGFLGIAAGIEAYVTNNDEYVLPYLNGTPYTQLNGDNDEFANFKPLAIAFQKRLQEVSTQYQHSSKYKLAFWHGGHAPDMQMVFNELNSLFTQPLNRYPTFFEGPMGYNRARTMPGFPGIRSAIDSAFWVKASGYPTPADWSATAMYLLTEVKGQTISFTAKDDTFLPTALTLTLVSQLLNLNQPVQVTYNGTTIFNGNLPAANADGSVTLTLQLPAR